MGVGFQSSDKSKIFIFLTVATAGEGQIDRSSKKLIKKAKDNSKLLKIIYFKILPS
jgi:hypothetical protein